MQRDQTQKQRPTAAVGGKLKRRGRLALASQSPLCPSICLCHRGPADNGEKHTSANREGRMRKTEETNVRLRASSAHLYYICNILKQAAWNGPKCHI